MGVANPPARSSPLRYPSISLAEAIQKVRVLYQAAHQRRMPRGELAQNLGYSTLNGASIGLISNLGRYGLLDGRGESVRVSDLAVVLLVEPRESRERQEAVRRAAASPELFQELNDDFQGAPQPTENSVRIRLERKGFPRKQAEVASRAYCETLALVRAEGGAYNEPEVVQAEDDLGGFMQAQALASPAPAIAPKAAAVALPSPAAGFKQDVFSLDEGEAVIRWPEGLSAASYEDFKGWLQLVLRKVARAAGVPDEPAKQ